MSAGQNADGNTPPVHRREYSLEETAERGDAIYERTIRAQVEPDHTGKVVAIDIESGVWALAEDALSAARELRARVPHAEVWLVRVGYRALHRIGAHGSSRRL